MSETSHYRKPGDLPQTVPVFPLSGALLLPRGHLPLNIFEPRYLNMVDDALSTTRIIGMVQPMDQENRSNPKIYPVGCAGRLTSFRETPDGRYLITLTGISRFRLERELDCTTPYRQVQVTFAPYANDFAPEDDGESIDRARLTAALKTYLQMRNMETDWEAIEGASNEGLVNSLSMIGDFDVEEKQMLLEAETLSKRATILTALIEFANAPGPQPPGSSVQ